MEMYHIKCIIMKYVSYFIIIKINLNYKLLFIILICMQFLIYF